MAQTLIKIIPSSYAVLLVVCLIGDYPYWYFMGSLRPSIWGIFNPISDFLLLIIIFSLLLITWLVSLLIRKGRLRTTVIVVGFLICLGLEWCVFPRPGSLVVYGIRDHVMKVCTLDDLRRFAKTVHTDMPDIDVVRIDPTALDGQRAADYRKLQQTYPFLTWGLGPGSRPYVNEGEGKVTVEWGGALPGQWGFSVSVNGAKNDPYPDPNTQVVRMSDDIYFFHGD